MADINRPNIEVWKRRFRRKYATDLPGLRTLSDAIAAEAGEFVTFTSTNVEGSGAAGVVTGNKLEMLAAVEEVLSEVDDTVPRAVASGLIMRFEP